jgi:hypothetical protein
MSDNKKETLVPIHIFGDESQPVQALEKSRKVKGSDETRVAYLLKFDPAEVINDLLNKLDAQTLGNAILREIVLPACYDASSEAIKADADGNTAFSEADFIEAFWQNFLPPDRGGRAGGVKVADLRAKVQELSQELLTVIKTYTDEMGRGVNNESTKLKLANLTLEMGQLNEAIEKKSRGAKVAKAA